MLFENKTIKLMNSVLFYVQHYIRYIFFFVRVSCVTIKVDFIPKGTTANIVEVVPYRTMKAKKPFCDNLCLTPKLT